MHHSLEKSIMKTPITLFTLLMIKEMYAAVVQSPPTFATPILSDSYLPATMQVIFHAVEQLRQLKIEGIEYNSNILISSSPSPPGLTTWQIVSRTGENIEPTTITPEISAKNQSTASQMVLAVNNESVESNCETTETTDVITETNFEKTEVTRQHQFMVENMMERPYESFDFEISSETSPLLDLLTSNANTTNWNEVTYKKKNNDGNNIAGKQANFEDDEEKTRFTLSEEMITKVPRPSLMSYLKLTTVPLRGSLQQLASLYDALNKDAKKQGFAKYAGYSDEILKALEISVGGGIGPQLKSILENTLERNELTREDSKAQAKEVLVKLEDSGSHLSTDLRRLLPLRYIP